MFTVLMSHMCPWKGGIWRLGPVFSLGMAKETLVHAEADSDVALRAIG